MDTHAMRAPSAAMGCAPAPTADRRSFLLKSLAVGAAGTGLLAMPPAAVAVDPNLSSGDVAILRFLSALEIIESDLWQQYNELGGIQDGEVPGGSGNKAYTGALQVLDEEMDRYIHDNTEDEYSHFTFINAYLVASAADPVNLDR